MRSSLVFLVSCVLVVSLVSSLVPVDKSEERLDASAEASFESVLRIGFLEKVDSLNPYLGLTDASRFFYSLVYDSLFSVGNDLEAVGNLAVGWRVVPETDPDLVLSGEPYGSVWEYDISENAKWHDGEPFTAEDAEWVLDLNAVYFDGFWSTQPYSYFMHYAERVDDYVLRIHFYDRETAEPLPVSYGDTLYIPMIPRHLLSSLTPFDIAFNWTGIIDGSDPPAVGTGPFVVGDDIYDQWLEGDRLTLYANPDHHWAADRGEQVGFDRLEMYFFDDSTAMALAVEVGELDVAQLPPRDYLSVKEDVESGNLTNLETFDGPKCTQLWNSVAINMNEAGPNLARLDLPVRQAMAMATNKEFIVDYYYLGLAEVGSTIISTAVGDWHHEPTPDESYDYDLDAAAQLLEDSGYRFTLESPDVRVATTDSRAYQEGWVAEGTPLEFDMVVMIERPEDREIASYLDNVWMAVGIDVNYMVVTETMLWSIVYSYTYDLAILPWSSDPDPNRMLFTQAGYSWNGWSDNRYYNASYDESYDASVSAMDTLDRKAHVDECQRIHYLDVGHIVMAYQYQRYVWRTDTFSNWGDWAADPGRSLDAYWGVNPLLFDLEYNLDFQLVPYERESRFSMMVPGGWALTEDEVIGDTEFDLCLMGPTHSDFQTSILLDSDRVRGIKETREYLESEMEAGFEEMEAEGISTTIVRAPTYWEGANYSALRFAYEWDSLALIQDMTLYADYESGMVWVLVCSVHSDSYSAYEPLFEEVAESLDVVEGDLVPTLVYIAMAVTAVVVIAVVAVVVVLLVARRKRSNVPGPAPGQLQPGICQACGAPLVSGGMSCPRCGRGTQHP